MSNETVVRLMSGKYELRHENGRNFRALRYGEPWRDLTGDGMVLALVQRIEELEEAALSAQQQEQGAGYDVGWKIRGVTAYDEAKRKGYRHPECVEAAIKAAPPAEPAAQVEAIGEVRENGVTWFRDNPHAYPIGTRFYTAPPAQPAERVPEVPRRKASDYASGTYGPDDLAAIWNCCCEAHKRASTAPSQPVERVKILTDALKQICHAHRWNTTAWLPSEVHSIAFRALEAYGHPLVLTDNGEESRPMTAPDDVRAMFEAWFVAQAGPDLPLNRMADGGYLCWETGLAWNAYRAALAHLSGEVREVAAWQRRIKHDSGKWLAWVYFAGAVDYDNDRARFPDRVGRWECEYRPLYAHADLREWQLEETAPDGEFVDVWVGGTENGFRYANAVKLGGVWCDRNGYRLTLKGIRLWIKPPADPALAKFTQEKP